MSLHGFPFSLVLNTGQGKLALKKRICNTGSENAEVDKSVFAYLFIIGSSLILKRIYYILRYTLALFSVTVMNH